MDHAGDVTDGGCHSNQCLDRFARRNVDDGRADFEACVEQHLGRCVSVLLAQVGQQDMFTRAYAAGNRLANRTSANDDCDFAGIFHEDLM
ncbi:hypothetical protein D3C80_1874240 [compost metagenome]